MKYVIMLQNHWGLKEVLVVNCMDDLHVLVQMRSERDFLQGWAREGRTMGGSTF